MKSSSKLSLALPPLLLVASMFGGSAKAADAFCSLSNLSSCNMTLDNVVFSNFSFSGFTPNSGDVFNLSGTSTAGGTANLSFAPARTASIAGGTFSYTATLLNGYMFSKAQANLTGATLNGSSMSTQLSSSGLPVSATSTNGFGTPVSFNPNLTTQTFTQTFAFNFAGGADNITQAGGIWNATPVPGPLAVVGVGAAMGFSRKLRQRVRQSA
ncbi:MAG: hypothetical protein VKP70_10370 [Cyanobacteriota bacterium]|nr:hypothetical protein [Cyanobacteriota bacterium]